MNLWKIMYVIDCPKIDGESGFNWSFKCNQQVTMQSL